MTGLMVAAALASAAIHAGWNAAVRAAPDPNGGMAAQAVGAGLWSIPLLLVLPWPSAAALPWFAASTVFNLGAMIALVRGYGAGGGFGFVYPVARAVSPLLVTLLAAATAGERLSTAGYAGIALVSAGVGAFALGDGRRNRAAFGWAIAAGACVAAYVVCDAQAARRSPSTVAYGALLSVANAITFGITYRVRQRASIRAALRAHPWVATLGAGAGLLGYVLILWVWRSGPIALGSALRDTSIVFAAGIGVLLLGERMTLVRAVAVGLVASGAAVLRLA